MNFPLLTGCVLRTPGIAACVFFARPMAGLRTEEDIEHEAELEDAWQAGLDEGRQKEGGHE